MGANEASGIGQRKGQNNYPSGVPKPQLLPPSSFLPSPSFLPAFPILSILLSSTHSHSSSTQIPHVHCLKTETQSAAAAFLLPLPFHFICFHCMCHFPFQPFFYSPPPLFSIFPNPVPIYCCFYVGIANESSSSFPLTAFFATFQFHLVMMPFPNKGS